MSQTYINSTFSGQENRGIQVANNSGHITYTIYNSQLAHLPITNPRPSSTVPFRRDPDFVYRETLVNLEQKCIIPAARVALVGLGGVGKSQLAIEYCYQLREKFPETWVFWVHANTPARFEEGYRKIAQRVNPFGWTDPKADVVQIVCNWLSDEANGKWILVLDNADDGDIFFSADSATASSKVAEIPYSLSKSLPNSPNGSILITSRSRDVALRLTGNDEDILGIKPMDEMQALTLFHKRLGNLSNESETKELVQALDYMPLAITQAAAYIRQRQPRITVSKYLDNLRRGDKDRVLLLEKDMGDIRRDSGASNSILATWQISFEYIQTQRPSATRLLSLMSFFDRQGIPEFLLHENSADSGIDHGFEEDISLLRSYALIGLNMNGDMFDMHRLVQFSTRQWLELHDQFEEWKEKYIYLVETAFPLAVFKNWPMCRTLLPHAEVSMSYRPLSQMCLMRWTELLFRAAWYAETQGRHILAEKLGQEALTWRESLLGKEDPATLEIISHLAEVLGNLGRYEAAEEMSRRALHGREKALGKAHPQTLTSLSNLASILQDQGKYEAAEVLFRKALEMHVQLMGVEHPNTLIIAGNLASVLQDLEHYDVAETMSKQALDGYEKMLGEDHPDTLISAHNFASILRSQGKYEEAEDVNRRALLGLEKVLGKEHPNTLASINTLALSLSGQGKYDAAEILSRQANEGCEKALGKEHPQTLTCIHNYALLLQYQGNYQLAEELCRKALDGRQKVLGEAHPLTLLALSDIASLLYDQEKPEAAEEIRRHIRSGSAKPVGREGSCLSSNTSMLGTVLIDPRQLETDEASVLRSGDLDCKVVTNTNQPSHKRPTQQQVTPTDWTLRKLVSEPLTDNTQTLNIPPHRISRQLQTARSQRKYRENCNRQDVLKSIGMLPAFHHLPSYTPFSPNPLYSNKAF